MKLIKLLGSFTTLAIIISVGFSPIALAVAEPPLPETPEQLSFIQLKVTGEEYIVIQNNSTEDILNLGQYALKAYNNVNPLASNATSSNQALPSFRLNQGEKLLLSSSIRPTCGASLAGKLSLSLVDGGGYLEIVTTAGGLVVDNVSWSSTTTGQIPSVPSNTKAPLALYYRYGTGNEHYGWQLAEQHSTDACSVTVKLAGTTGDPVVVPPTMPDNVPSDLTVIGLGQESEGLPSDQESSPVPIHITELLPNPVGTGNDSTDEFIELYNPNETEVNIGGYTLQTGVTSLHNFSFKSDTMLPAKTHVAFYSAQTGLSLTNSVGQARLLTASGQIVSVTDVYRTAKDGQSWTMIDTVWSWSLAATADKPNISTPPVVTANKVTTTTAKKTSKVATPKTPKTPKAAKAKKPKQPKKVTVANSQFTIPTAETVMSRPLQTKVVATVGSIALLYGAYEYRSDLANGIYKLRRKLSFGRPNRS